MIVSSYRWRDLPPEFTGKNVLRRLPKGMGPYYYREVKSKSGIAFFFKKIRKTIGVNYLIREASSEGSGRVGV
jgi:hypothetical protein